VQESARYTTIDSSGTFSGMATREGGGQFRQREGSCLAGRGMNYESRSFALSPRHLILSRSARGGTAGHALLSEPPAQTPSPLASFGMKVETPAAH
jgi:hypothetical protein